MKPLLIVGTPCFGGLVTQHYMLSMFELVAAMQQCGVGFSAIMIGHESLITRGRSAIVAQFMDNPDATHLLFVDADISFDVDQVGRMLKFDADFVAGMYRVKKPGQIYVGELCEDPIVKDGFATAIYAGGGFQLIKRRVFERMFERYQELKFKGMHVSYHSTNLYALFDTFIGDDGIYLSEDYSFCRRWRAIGGEVWLDLNSKLNHHSGGYTYYGDAAQKYRHLLIKAEAAE